MIIEVNAFDEKMEILKGRGGISDMSINIRNITGKDLKKRQQTTRYYTLIYSTNNTPYKTVIITETAVPFVPPPDTVGTMTIFYPTCHVFDCSWNFYYDAIPVKSLTVGFSEISPPVTFTVTQQGQQGQNIVTATATITNGFSSSTPALQYEESNNLYPSDVKYVVVGTIGGAVIGILSGIALSYGYYKLKVDEGIPTPSHRDYMS
ncbi:8188_t:CDS:1 [Cetraspora pellucida]|uniref:8188_t:CDS:1 n=1 Tax=Cetraspora pellucida TaxID=1433469 RepID=A0A9N9JYG7_9GLOM|nr:8188_t:CDS:1 [Cetraspora pellucida]